MTSVYTIWRRPLNANTSHPWVRTFYTLEACSDKEAQSKLRRKFAKGGFQSMSLVAVPIGTEPSQLIRGTGKP